LSHLVYDLIFITGILEKMKPWVLYMRQKYIRDAFDSFEYLYNEMKEFLTPSKTQQNKRFEK